MKEDEIIFWIVLVVFSVGGFYLLYICEKYKDMW